MDVRLFCLLYFAQVLQRADHSFRTVLPVVCLIVCDLETSVMRLPRPDLGSNATGNYSTCADFLCVLVTRIKIVYFQQTDTWNVWENCRDRTNFGREGVCWYKIFVNDCCVLEHEVPTDLHLQPPNFPPVGLSRRISRAYSSIACVIRRVQDTDDKSHRTLLQKFGRKLNIGLTLRETFWLS
jgi:hypothetical protein